MVLLERIELSTSPLPRECSTSELQQRCVGAFSPSGKRAQEVSGEKFPLFCGLDAKARPR